MVAGAHSIDQMDMLRHGGMGKLFTGSRAPSTLVTFLRLFTFGHVRQLDPLPDRPTALHQDHQRVDAVLARPQPALPRLRTPPTDHQHRRAHRRDRARPARYLLGLTRQATPAEGLQSTQPCRARPWSGLVWSGGGRLEHARIRLQSC